MKSVTDTELKKLDEAPNGNRAAKPRSAQEIRQALGDYHAPQGLYEKLKAMPFLGSVKCNVERMIAGSWQEIVLDYEVGSSGMADGSWFKATFRFYSDWALFQTTDPAAANYISAEYHAGGLVPGRARRPCRRSRCASTRRGTSARSRRR